MKRLSDEQFKDYRFVTGSENSVYGSSDAIMVSPGGDAVGSILVTHNQMGRNNIQRRINMGSSEHHGTVNADPSEGQIPGQRRWDGGNFDSIDPHVSFMGVHTDHRHPALVAGLVAAVVGERGGHVPMADSELSEDGSRIAKGMARRFGVRGHPKNPDMDQTLNWGTNTTADTNRLVTGHADARYRMLLNREAREETTLRTWTPAEAEAVANELEAKHSTRPRKQPTVVNEDQMRLF